MTSPTQMTPPHNKNKNKAKRQLIYLMLEKNNEPLRQVFLKLQNKTENNLKILSSPSKIKNHTMEREEERKTYHPHQQNIDKFIL
jgi:hypothetical protein